MSSGSSTTNSGIGFFGLLFIVFLVLKLTGYIGWSWWAVTAPLWGPAVFWIAVLVIIGVVGLIASLRS